MSTTRTNDKALTKKQQDVVNKRQPITDITKQFKNSKYANRTELIYLLHDAVPGCERVDCKVGRTSMNAALVSRSEQGYTYKNGYRFLDGTLRKRYDPISDKERQLLEADFTARIESKEGFVVKTSSEAKRITKLEQACDYFIAKPHDGSPIEYIATSRFGDPQYIRYHNLHGYWAFPYEIVDEVQQNPETGKDEVVQVLHDQDFWEGEVDKVLKPFRLKYRITEIESYDYDEYGNERVVMAKVQNTAENAENALFPYAIFKDYLNLYNNTCRELGGIFIKFTTSYSRGQINDQLRKRKFYDSNFAAEQTKCHWEGIKRYDEYKTKETVDKVIEETERGYLYVDPSLKQEVLKECPQAKDLPEDNRIELHLHDNVKEMYILARLIELDVLVSWDDTIVEYVHNKIHPVSSSADDSSDDDANSELEDN